METKEKREKMAIDAVAAVRCLRHESKQGERCNVRIVACSERIVAASQLPALAEGGDETDLARTLRTGFGSCITIMASDEAEGRRIVAGWPDDKVREYAINWVARAGARQRLADDAISEILNLRNPLVAVPEPKLPALVVGEEEIDEDENLIDEICPNCGGSGVPRGSYCHETNKPWPVAAPEPAVPAEGHPSEPSEQKMLESWDDYCRLGKTFSLCPTYDAFEGGWNAAREEMEAALERYRVENDRLQQRVKDLERRLEGIADQYAVDCL